MFQSTRSSGDIKTKSRQTESCSESWTLIQGVLRLAGSISAQPPKQRTRPPADEVRGYPSLLLSPTDRILPRSSEAWKLRERLLLIVKWRQPALCEAATNPLDHLLPWPSDCWRASCSNAQKGNIWVAACRAGMVLAALQVDFTSLCTLLPSLICFLRCSQRNTLLTSCGGAAANQDGRGRVVEGVRNRELEK